MANHSKVALIYLILAMAIGSSLYESNGMIKAATKDTLQYHDILLTGGNSTGMQLDDEVSVQIKNQLVDESQLNLTESRDKPISLAGESTGSIATSTNATERRNATKANVVIAMKTHDTNQTSILLAGRCLQ